MGSRHQQDAIVVVAVRLCGQNRPASMEVVRSPHGIIRSHAVACGASEGVPGSPKASINCFSLASNIIEQHAIVLR